MQRVLQTYYATVDGVLESFGGGAVTAPATLVFDLIDLGASSNTPATVLYDGSTLAPIASTPASCIFAAVNVTQIFGSIAYTKVTQTGSAWAVSTLPSGIPQTRPHRHRRRRRGLHPLSHRQSDLLRRSASQ